MNFIKIKSIFFRTLIGCLVAAATLAVVTILLGKFNDVAAKALFTILIIALHALIGLSFIQNNEKQATFENLALFTNATFGIIALSFITSIFGLWGIIPGDIVGRLYALYFVLLFAILHGEVLYKATGKQETIDKLILANYVFMSLVVIMLLPVIFIDGSSLGSIYYRSLAAAGIIDATLTLISVILHALYVQKHPKIVDPVFSIQQVQVPGGLPGQTMQVQVPQQKRHLNGFVIILLAFVALQFLGGIIVGILGAFNR